jgi:hypothetical protein
MPYLINKSDGTTLTTVPDGQVDDITTDLVLIGKNYSGFGESLNENFVKLLENFANTSRPIRPIRGQLWFDTSEVKLKIYNGNAFVPVSSAAISNTQPNNLTPGDLWFNDIDKQLYFFDGVNVLLLGPDYSTSQGISGVRVQTVLDTNNQSRVITLIYNSGTLMGIFSTDAFTPKQAISGFTGTITPGFNQGNLSNFKFNVTSANSDRLGGIGSEGYIKRDANGQITGDLSVEGTLLLGPSQQHSIEYSGGNMNIRNTEGNKFITIIGTRGSSTPEDALRIEPENRVIKFYDGLTDSSVITGGNLIVTGNLTVQGTTTTLNSTTVTVEDTNIVLARNATNDSQVDGGGITLKGTTDKSIAWSNQYWISSENFDLANGKHYAIGGVKLLEEIGDTGQYRLTSSVVEANGIQIFGIQNEFTVDNIFLNGNTISSLNVNGDLNLSPNGTGNIVLQGSPRVTGMGEPIGIQDAATKNYVDTQLRARSLAFSFDISDGISSSGIAGWLTKMAPPAEYANGTIARLLCTSLANTTSLINMNTFLSESSGTFNTPSGVASALIDVNFSPVTVPAPAIIVTRIVKEFEIIGGAWQYIRDIP